MPLESGITVPPLTSDRDAQRQFIQDSLAYCENVPLIALQPNLAAIDAALLKFRTQDLAAITAAMGTTENVRRRVFIALARSLNVREIMEEVEGLLYTSSYSYLAPLFRLLRDHHYYAWYEALQIINALRATEAGHTQLVEHDLFLDHRVVSALSRVGDGNYLLTGPVVLESLHPSEGKFQRDARESLARFNKDISRAWQYRTKIAIQGGYDLRSGPIYTVEHLTKHAFQRQKTNVSDLLFAHEKITHLFEGLGASRWLDDMRNCLPVHMYSRIIAAASALFDLSKANLEKPLHKVLSVKRVVDGASSTVKLLINSCGMISPIDAGPPIGNSSILTYQVERAIDRAFTNWQSYQYESFGLFRDWLNNKFGYISRFSKSPAEDLAYADFGSRIARFLARLYRADECTIYRVNYQSQTGELVRQGAFLNRSDADLRLRMMADHMIEIAGSAETRKMSICYRAADRVRTEYCRFENKDAARTGDFSSCLSYPESDEIKSWGVSAISTPILVQGVPWGVVELISDRPHHFSGAARAKVEDVASILSPFFYFQSVFDALERAGNAAGNIDLALEERKRQLLIQLFDVFMCKAVAIVTRENAPDRAGGTGTQRTPSQHIHLFGHQGDWWFPNVSAAKVSLGDLMPFAKIPFGENYYWACKIDGETLADLLSVPLQEFPWPEYIERNKGDSLLALRLSLPQDVRSGREEFVIAIVLRKEIIVDLKLIELFAFFGTFLIPMLDSFYSHENWEKVLRNRLGHELSKIWRNIESTQKKFEQELGKGNKLNFANDAVEGTYLRLVADLKRHARSVQLYSEILSRKRDNLAFRDHPQVYITRQRMAQERKRPVSLRQIYSSAFMGRSAEFSARSIIVDTFNFKEDVRIESYEWLLLDVMQTIADNILKHALSGRELKVSVERGSFGNVHFKISNLGPALTEEDWGRIFTEGGRGTYARSKNIKGEGIGLFLAQRMMAVAGYDLDYKYHPAEKPLSQEGFPVVWHDFIMVFPAKTRLLQR
jgi:signal transduction histidine kinase